MIRTQISLTAVQKQALDERSQETGLSLSELVRRALDSCYGHSLDAEADIAVIRRTAGAWRDRDFTGEEFVDGLRARDRLARSAVADH